MDRSLATLLRSFQTSDGSYDALRFLPTATTLLSRLSNPLNVSLLSSQLLENDLLYPQPITLKHCQQIFSVFYTAFLRFREDKRTRAQENVRSNLSEGEWVTAVVKGAGDTSPRWRHTLMLGGLLLAGSARDEEPLYGGLRQKLEAALVDATNLALEPQNVRDGDICVIFVLSNTFQLLSDMRRAQLHYDVLLPLLLEAVFFSSEGLQHGYWLASINQDVVSTHDRKLTWSVRSASFARIQEIKSRPFVSGLGSMSRLIAHSVNHLLNGQVILDAMAQATVFARNLANSWRQNKLAEIDVHEEPQYLAQETTDVSMPVLLHLLRHTMFAMIITLRSVLGRLLCDPLLASNVNAPGVGIQSLQILRDMYFISHRFGQTSFSQYNFVNFTALDILSQYPRATENFLASIKPPERATIPQHPLDRNLDLYFLNTAEHLTLTVSAQTNEDLLSIASPYVQCHGDPRLGELFEAAHSLMLAVFAAPQSTYHLARQVPPYVETLLRSFPQKLNARQFRLAIKSILRLTAPPSQAAIIMPHMQAVMLDLLTQRFLQAAEIALPPPVDVPVESQQPLSEKAVFLMTIIDSLPFLPVPLLEEYLPVTAELLFKIQNHGQRMTCQKHLWELLSNGEMDVERAAACVAWWNSKGGFDSVMFGDLPEQGQFAMSGAVQQDSKL